jgi:hypothetical protein
MPAATNRVQLSFIEETTFGTTPSGALQKLRFTSESLNQTTGTTTSTEIREDRQIPDVVRSSVGAAGDVGFEVYLNGAMTTLMKAALQTDSTTSGDVTATGVSCNTTQNVGRIAAASGTPFANLAVGSIVKIAGAANAATNGIFRVLSVGGAGANIVVAGTIGADESAVSLDVTEFDHFDNGKTQKSFSFEKKFGDLTNTFEATRGATIESMSLTVPTDGILTGSFSFIGKNSQSATATIGTGYTDDSTESVASSIDNVPRFQASNKDLTLTEFTMSVANNLRGRQEIGSASTTSIGAGTCQVTGSFSAYFSDDAAVADIVTDFQNGTAIGMDLVIDVGSYEMLVAIPSARLTSATRVAGGQNQDVIMEVGFEAFLDSTLSSTVRIGITP